MKIAAELPPEPEPLDKSPQLRLVVDDKEHTIGRDEPHEGEPKAKRRPVGSGTNYRYTVRNTFNTFFSVTRCRLSWVVRLGTLPYYIPVIQLYLILVPVAA